MNLRFWKRKKVIEPKPTYEEVANEAIDECLHYVYYSNLKKNRVPVSLWPEGLLLSCPCKRCNKASLTNERWG